MKTFDKNVAYLHFFFNTVSAFIGLVAICSVPSPLSTAKMFIFMIISSFSSLWVFFLQCLLHWTAFSEGNMAEKHQSLLSNFDPIFFFNLLTIPQAIYWPTMQRRTRVETLNRFCLNAKQNFRFFGSFIRKNPAE